MEGTASWADRASAAISAAARALRTASVPSEALAELVPAGRRFGVLKRPATMRPLGEAWRLGVLLLGVDGALYAAGRSTRAAERGRPNHQSLSREDRREIAAAALRGGYPVGAPVHFDAVAIPISQTAPPDPSGTLGLLDGELRVRWRSGASLADSPGFESYLAERVGLLTDPPLGST